MEQSEMLAMIRDSRLEEPPRSGSGRLSLTPTQYPQAYADSVANLGKYWAGVARELQWTVPWQQDLVGQLPDFRFFQGGYSNVSVNCIDRHLERRADRPALIGIREDGGETVWSWQELHRQTATFARALSDLGVKEGDVVAIFLPNLLETFAAVHACYRIGAIYNIIFSGFSRSALLDRLADTQAKVVITADEAVRRGRRFALKATLDQALADVPSVQHVVVIRRTGAPVPMQKPRDHYWDELMDHTASGQEPVPIEANAPGFIIYTSGTTSKPKGLVHSGLGFLVGSYHNVKYALDLGPDDVYWCTADVGWLTFPIFELVGGLAHGATYLVYEGALDYPEPGRLYDIIARHRVNKVFTAPTVLRMLARQGTALADSYNLESLELISLVGEPLDASTWYWVARELGKGRIEINNTYGQSETGSAWTSSLVGVTAAKPGSCGLPLPGHAYAIVDDGGHPVPAGKVGELVLTAPFPTLARTIWGDDARYRSQYFARPEFYATRDAAVEDHDHHIWVLGRVDDVINVAAHRLSTMEMESAVLTLPEVAEAAVIGVPDDIKGQVPVAFVTLRQGIEEPSDLAQRVKSQVTDTIGAIARPAEVYRVDAMPKTRSGKIVRRLLKEIVTTGGSAGDITGLEDPEVLERLLAQLGRPPQA
ncbi:MAG: acetate--CoA ligase [Thermaerobacter sp.]|nr:acetate--CoA ligase [Thermaerobacter sp.]